MPPHNAASPGETGSKSGFNFSTFFIKNPVTTLILMLILVVLGIASYTQLPPDLMPNIEFPVVVVNTPYPGAAPAEVETLITKPLEDALAGLNGLDTLMSSSTDGVSTVICQLQIGVDSKVADDVRDRVSSVIYKLPKDARPPNYMTFDTSSIPICYYTISGPMSKVALSTYVQDDIVPKLEQADGVATIQLTGDLQPDVEVALDPDRLAAYRLSMAGVFADIQAENFNLPGGLFDARPRQLTVRTMGKFKSPQALSHLFIPTSQGGMVALGDLGTVRNSVKDPTTAAAIDGHDAIVFGVIKQTTANVVSTVAAVDGEIAQIAPSLPQGVHIVKASDTSRFIKMSNDAVWEHLAMGALLAVLVLFVFLRNWRVMIIAGLAIPLSIVMAFTPMKLAGFTFNNVTMLALSLVVGILVDDAVVDLENIFRHMENGESPIQAAIHATGEIQLAVTATSMTIVAVFLPMSFMTGMVGQFMSSFGLTVTFTVLFSLLIARTLTPMLAAYMLKVKPKAEGDIHIKGDLSGRYPRFLRWCLKHRFLVMAVATATFLGGLSLARFIPTEFMSNADRGEFYLRIEMPKGTPLAQTLATANQVAAKVRTYPGVSQVLTTIGSTGELDEAQLDVLLVDRSQRKFSDLQLEQQVRQAYANVPGFQVMADEPSFGGGGGMAQKPIDVQILGSSLTQLKQYSDKLAAMMARSPMFVDIETSLSGERSELRVIPDRVRMAQVGITAAQLAENLLLATTGDTPNTMTVGSDEVDVWVRMDAYHRQHLTSLDSLPIMTSKGPVPLGAIARTEIVGGYSVIEHRNRQRVVHVAASLPLGVTVGTATAYLQRAIVPKLALPASLTIDMQGQAKEQRDAFAGFGQAMVLGIAMIYFVLALQFSSFLYPLTIMFSLPLAVSGALLALLVGHKSLSLMSLIGIIMLMGIVTKNAILIVDFILTMRERGYERTEAVLRGAQVRMRPILMTTAAMVLGMLPMALGIGAGSEFRAPMAVVVIGGLLTSTFLTLIVVPVGYTLMEDLKGFFTRLLFKRQRSDQLVSPEPPPTRPLVEAVD